MRAQVFFTLEMTACDLVGTSLSIAATSHASKMYEISSSVLMVILIIDGSSEGSNPCNGSNPCQQRAMAIVKAVATSVIMMAEGGGDGKVEQ
jgi:hypothetical protein